MLMTKRIVFRKGEGKGNKFRPNPEGEDKTGLSNYEVILQELAKQKNLDSKEPKRIISALNDFLGPDEVFSIRSHEHALESLEKAKFFERHNPDRLVRLQRTMNLIVKASGMAERDRR